MNFSKAALSMHKEIKFKLTKISEFWSHYIWHYQKCRKEINYDNGNIKTTSFGDLMSYLGDTLEVIDNKIETNNFHRAFSYHIGLLQAIYIQQDLIEELLRIFGCNINKVDLYNDENYSINRTLRNELVGHPIRKYTTRQDEKKTMVLKSSVLMDINSNSSKISYSRYHVDNDYSFEKLSYQVDDIITKHYIFLNTYLNRIIIKCKRILKAFKKRVENLQSVAETQNFEVIVKLVALDFEKILDSSYLYEPKYLIESFKRKDEHKRYQNNLDQFISDLNHWIFETLRDLEYTFQKRKHLKQKPEINTSIFKQFNKKVSKQKLSYHYELGKLSYKREYSDFQFFGGLLKDKCLNNNEVLIELEHMKNNLQNDMEYHCSLKLIRKILED